MKHDETLIEFLENLAPPVSGDGNSSILVKQLAGRVDVGMLVKSRDGAQRWRIEGLGLIGSADAYAAGTRALTLRHLAGGLALTRGTVLSVVHDD